jgi:NhaP-type Na+/H+ or K+/H+ antiporter
VGFGVGVVIGAFALQGMFGEGFLVGTSGTIILYAITGTIGGASLGAALGYLQDRNLADRQRPKVR